MGDTKSIGVAYRDQDLNGSTLTGCTTSGGSSSGETLTSPTISGGTINNAVIGGTTPTAATFTTMTATTTKPGQIVVTQGAPTAKTTSSTLTAANIAAGIITVNQGAAGASAQQLPTAADMDTGFADVAAGQGFDFSVINISTVDAEDASITTNTGWTLVGSMDVLAYNAAGTASSGRFRARKTGTAAWTLYRLS